MNALIATSKGEWPQFSTATDVRAKEVRNSVASWIDAFLPLGFRLAKQERGASFVSGTAPEGPSRWLPVGIGVVVCLLALLVWRALLVQQYQTLTDEAQLAALQVTNELDARFEARIQGLNRMRERWEQHPPNRAEWEADAAAYLRDFPGFQALTWADADAVIRWVVPLAGNEAVQSFSARDNPAQHTRDAARAQRTVLLSPIYELAQGGQGFLLVAPLLVEEAFQGVLNGVCRVQTVMDTILADIAPGYGVTLMTEGQPFYQRVPQEGPAAQGWQQTTRLLLPGVTWQVQVWPGPGILAQHRSALPSVVLTLGLLLGGVLTYTAFMTQLARQRAWETASANQQLAALNVELEQRIQERTAALVESEVRYRTIFGAAGVAIWEEDFSRVIAALEELRRQGVQDFRQYFVDHPDFVCQAIGWVRVLDVNAAAVRLCGAPDKGALLTSLHTIFLPETQSMFMNELLALTEDRFHFEAQSVLQTLQGERRHVLTAITFPSGGESYDRVLVSRMDISDRVRAETELQRVTDDLRQIAYIAAHDLQEPVRQVGLYSQKLAKRYPGAPDAATTEDVGFIVEAAQRMVAQLNDLMHYLEVDAAGVERRATNCEDVLQRALEQLRTPISASNAAITHDPLPTLDAVPAHLQLIFQELIDNALKFHEGTPPQVHVWATRETRAWRFAVREHGIGIDPQVYGKLFGLFRRLDRNRFPGTGMGLAVCKKIVERHDGGIWLEPTPGGGVTMMFTIGDVEEKVKN